MARMLTARLPIIDLCHNSGKQLSLLGVASDSVWIARNPGELARAFQQAVQKHIEEEEDYLELLRYLPDAKPSVHTLAVTIPASKSRGDDQDYELAFEAIIWEVALGGVLVVLPAINISAYARNLDSWQKVAQDAVSLQLLRDKRLESQHKLIAIQWHQQIQVVYKEVNLTVYTPTELSRRREAMTGLLAKTATRMSKPRYGAVGIDILLEELTRNLSGDFRQSVLIVGPSGCGKTALIQEFARVHALNWQDLPWQTSASQLLQALTAEAGWQYALGAWVKELRAQGSIVYTGHLNELFEVGQYAGNDVSIADALREPLQRNEILLIAEVTQEQLELINLRSPGYSDLFHVIRFTDRTPQSEDHIALAAVQQRGRLSNVRLANDVVVYVQRLMRQFSPYSGFPGKTIRFFDNLLIDASNKEKTIDKQQAVHAFCEESGMPAFLIEPSIAFDEQGCKAALCQRVIGQQSAIDTLVQALIVLKMGLAKANKPIASLLFVGPTGVGKTELAKTLAAYVFGDEQRMIRFDMSEYSDPYAVMRLTSNSASSLVTKVRQQPFSVLLLDEIEKAENSFFDLLLQILGEGRLTDDKGDVANFCSSIVIMTSNIGAREFMRPEMGFRQPGANVPGGTQHFEHAIAEVLRPELINRIDQIVPFLPLNQKQRLAVMQKEVDLLFTLPGVVGRPIELTIDTEVLSFLARKQVGNKYGARNIQRLLLDYVKNPLARMLAGFDFEQPLKVDLRIGNQQIKIAVARVEKSKKLIRSVVEISDDIADFRRSVLGMEEGSIWIGLLSEQDRIEARKRKKKDTFWEEQENVKRLAVLEKITLSYAQIKQDTFELETHCVAQLREQEVNLLWDDFAQTLDNLKGCWRNFLLDTESIVNPKADHCVLAIYGPEEPRSFLLHWIQRWVENEKINLSFAGIYLDKVPNEKSPEETLLANKNQENVLSDADNQTEPENQYVIFETTPKASKYHEVGTVLTLTGRCVSHLFKNESGFIEWSDDEADKEKIKLFIDITFESLSDYHVPDGVHRKNFYRNEKIDRRIKGFTFYDKRYCEPNTYLPINHHGERMAIAAYKNIKHNLIRHYWVRKANEKIEVPD